MIDTHTPYSPIPHSSFPLQLGWLYSRDRPETVGGVRSGSPPTRRVNSMFVYAAGSPPSGNAQYFESALAESDQSVAVQQLQLNPTNGNGPRNG